MPLTLHEYALKEDLNEQDLVEIETLLKTSDVKVDELKEIKHYGLLTPAATALTRCRIAKNKLLREKFILMLLENGADPRIESKHGNLLQYATTPMTPSTAML